MTNILIMKVVEGEVEHPGLVQAFIEQMKAYGDGGELPVYEEVQPILEPYLDELFRTGFEPEDVAAIYYDYRCALVLEGLAKRSHQSGGAWPLPDENAARLHSSISRYARENIHKTARVVCVGQSEYGWSAQVVDDLGRLVELPVSLNFLPHYNPFERDLKAVEEAE